MTLSVTLSIRLRAEKRIEKLLASEDHRGLRYRLCFKIYVHLCLKCDPLSALKTYTWASSYEPGQLWVPEVSPRHSFLRKNFDAGLYLTGMKIFPYVHCSSGTGTKFFRQNSFAFATWHNFCPVRVSTNRSSKRSMPIMYRSIPKPPIPPPGQTPGHLTFLKNFGQIPRYVASLQGPMPHLLELQRGSNPPPSRHVTHEINEYKQNRLPLETNSAKFSAITNFLFSLSSLHTLNKGIFHDITI